MASASFEPDRQPEPGYSDEMKWLCQYLRHPCIGRRVMHLIDDANLAVPLFHTHDLDLVAGRRLLAEKDPDDEIRGEINGRRRTVGAGMVPPEFLPGRRGLNHERLGSDDAARCPLRDGVEGDGRITTAALRQTGHA